MPKERIVVLRSGECDALAKAILHDCRVIGILKRVCHGDDALAIEVNESVSNV